MSFFVNPVEVLIASSNEKKIDDISRIFETVFRQCGGRPLEIRSMEFEAAEVQGNPREIVERKIEDAIAAAKREYFQANGSEAFSPEYIVVEDTSFFAQILGLDQPGPYIKSYITSQNRGSIIPELVRMSTDLAKVYEHTGMLQLEKYKTPKNLAKATSIIAVQPLRFFEKMGECMFFESSRLGLIAEETRMGDDVSIYDWDCFFIPFGEEGDPPLTIAELPREERAAYRPRWMTAQDAAVAVLWDSLRGPHMLLEKGKDY